jgi:holo-[acyl-carrier protein] synthase
MVRDQPVDTDTARLGTGVRVALGTDLVSVTRIRQAAEAVGEDFLARVFTPAEQEAAAGDWERLAARWAAKEATLKALGAGVHDTPLLDVEVLPQPSGAPELRLSGSAEAAARRAGWAAWSVSLSHDGGMALAVVIAVMT